MILRVDREDRLRQFVVIDVVSGKRVRTFPDVAGVGIAEMRERAEKWARHAEWESMPRAVAK